MYPTRIWRSTPFRLALAFAGLFLASFMVSGYFAYAMIRAELTHRLDRLVDDTWKAIAASYSPSDSEDLLESVEAFARISDPRDRVFLLLDPAGNRVAGNSPADAFVLPAKPGPFGFRFKDHRYRARSGPAGPDRLVVAFSTAETEDVEDIARKSLAFMFFLVVVIALAGGYFLTRQLRKRLDEIAATMNRVSAGKFEARIPVRDRIDDIDAVSRQVNQAIERIGGLMEGLKQISYDIAHDLKTPLNRLRLAVEEALYAAENGLADADSLHEAVAECGRITDTFDALLRIAQIEAGARREGFWTVFPPSRPSARWGEDCRSSS